MQNCTFTLASTHYFQIGDLITIGPGRPWPRWAGSWTQDMDRAIIRWCFKLIGKPLAMTATITSMKANALIVRNY